MKKVIFAFGAASLLAFTACKNEEKETTTDNETVKETTVIKDETAPPPPPPPAVEEETDGTSVNISSDGVNVNSKDGDNKTTIDLNKDKAGVQIKK